MKDIPTNTRYKYIGPNIMKHVHKKPVASFHLFFSEIIAVSWCEQRRENVPKNIGNTKFHVKWLQSLGANQRNYAEIQITIEPEFSVITQLNDHKEYEWHWPHEGENVMLLQI